MYYIDELDLKQIGINWNETIKVIENAVKCLIANDFSQPIKPYLRYRNIKNRIIAMPAFLGQDIDIAGIKWIASFPENLKQGIPRAHSILILNESSTGIPKCIINSALLSIIRTASVSGFIINKFNTVHPQKKVNVGIIGFGPIGLNHLYMCSSLLKDKIEKIYLYDHNIEKIKTFAENNKDYNIGITKGWEKIYNNADIFITCTVSNNRYITGKPKSESLYLNVSLRDFHADTFEYFKNGIIVDNWDEICRENTDIEIMHKEKGLKKEDTKSILDIVKLNCLSDYPKEQSIFFNPMGMAVFDIAIAKYFYLKALEFKIGTVI